MTLYLMSNDVIMTKMIKAIFGKRNLDSRIDFINLSRKGISMGEFKKIQEYTSLTTKEISEILPVSERQLVRYKDDHVLRKDISSHLIQLVELFERGFEVFGNDKFKKWIRSEVRALGSNRPVELLDTPIGIQMVTDILGRIEHGVYS
jgi:putative toxin-antitoxin system antitoxin component (TIGR02293 family)